MNLIAKSNIFQEDYKNHVTDALSRTKIEKVMVGEVANSADATIHSASEDNLNYISITERLISSLDKKRR